MLEHRQGAPAALHLGHPRGHARSNGKARRAAEAISPEHGTVGADLIKEAAKEAVQGVGFDLLIVCGFAFDPYVAEEAKRYGRLLVLLTRINPDLQMGDEMLKKTGAGNLFMIFGEPDVASSTGRTARSSSRSRAWMSTTRRRARSVRVAPTTSHVGSSTPTTMASRFFVRHAYFTGADEPYEKLKRALRAEVDEAAWSALYSTKSYPFDPPVNREDRGEGDQPLWR